MPSTVVLASSIVNDGRHRQGSRVDKEVDLMPRKVLVTGVAGFLGSYVAEHFLAAGDEVVGIDSLLGGAKENVPEGTRFLVADCLDLDAYSAELTGVDVVYHCAAAPYEGVSVFSPFLVHQHTAGASVAMLSASAKAGVRRFVYCSSMARYGRQQPPFTEDMTPQPVDPYGIAKYAAELQVRCISEIYGMEWVVAVPHNIIGPRQKFDDPYRNVASIMINRILLGRPPLIYGDGEQRRCFSYIADVMQPLAKLADDPSVVGEVINLGPDEEYVSIRELARLVGEANCSADKARRLLGYRTQWTLRDGLAAMVAWIRAVGPREFTYHLPLEIVNEMTPVTWSHHLM
jgi:UDP-glucose 4-epimerase